MDGDRKECADISNLSETIDIDDYRTGTEFGKSVL